MARMFEVGNEYYAADTGIQPIKVMSRSHNTIQVYNGEASWFMRVKRDEKGDEYVVDSSVPKKWQFVYTYKA